MKHLMTMMLAAFLSVPIGSAIAQTDTTFTYQGVLNDGGQPASGSYNLSAALWDALAGGTQIGSTASFNGASISDGHFTIELDFGADAFDNKARWLEISVGETTLSPRQPITRSPYSIQTRGIHAADNGFVGVGRNDRVTINEVFGVHRPGTAFGGIYASTDAGGKPFYGYSNGTHMAYHYLDGNTGDWKLYVDGYRMTVTDEGNVGIGTQSPAAPLEIKASVSPASLATTSGNVAVHGESSSNNGNGVFGFASSFTGPTYGVYGRTQSTDGTGVLGWSVSSTGNNIGVYGVSNSGAGWDFYAGGAGQDYGSSSSIRWKSNVRAIDHPLDKISKLRGVYFDWDIDHGGNHDLGMIAEEVGAVLPEIVNYEENGIDAIGMDYSKMTPLLVEGLNALRVEKDRQIVVLTDENNSLRVRNVALDERLSHLEVQMELLAARLTAREGDSQ